MGLIFALSGVYFITWYLLLLRWIAIKEPCPVMGGGWKTRAFWGVTFLFFNPLLTLLYFLFGVLPSAKEYSRKRLSAMRMISLPLVVITVIFLELPIGAPRALPKKWTKAAPRTAQGEMTLLMNSAAEISATGSSGWHGYHYFDPSHVAIITHGEHPFLTHLGYSVASYFKTIPAVKSVTFHPAGKHFEEAAFMPTLFIELHEKRVNGLPLPAGLVLDVNIEISIKSSQYTTSRWTKLPIASVTAKSTIHEKFALFGVTSPAVKYNRIATKLLNDVGLSFGGFIYSWWQFESLPPVPDYMYGKGGAAPEHIFPETVPYLHLNGGHLLVHDMALREFSESEDLALLKTRFEEENWSAQKISGNYLRMVRDHEQIIFKKENAPLEARYINAFSPEDIDQALERLLADPNIGADTLILFGSSFRTSSRDDLFQAYHTRLESIAPTSFPIALERALVYEHAGELDKAKTMLGAARAHERLLTSKNGGWDMDDLAKRIGVNTADKTTIDMSLVKSLSLNKAAERDEGITQTLHANQTFRFHINRTEAHPARYFTARLTDPMWPMTPTAGGFYRGSTLKALSITEQTFEGATSHYFSVCAEKDGLLATQQMNIHLANGPQWTLTVSKAKNGALEWRLAPSN
jgi:hypothetical protein